MKKVLFLSLAEHTTLGGTQNYNYKLMQIFKRQGWNITEYNCYLGIDKVVRNKIDGVDVISNKELKESKNKLLEGRRFMKQVNKSNFEIAELINKNKFDLIIDSRQHPYTWYKKWGQDPSKKDNMIWVQHFCLGLFDGKYLSNSKFSTWIMKLYINYFSKNRYNVLYSHKNVVLFDENNKKKLDLDRFKTNPNIYDVKLTEYDKSYIKKQKDNTNRDIDFIFVGRLNQIQKNLKYINRVFNNYKYKITIIGAGEKKIEKLISKNKNINYLGFVNQDEISKYLSRSKFIFMPSNYEGFPYVIVQALSHGVIPIILNTYESAETFKDVGYVFDKNTSANQMKENLSRIHEEYNESKVIKAIDFAYNNLSTEIFEEKWIKIIKEHSC